MNQPVSGIVEFLGFTLGSGYLLFLAAQLIRFRLSGSEWAVLLSICGGLPWFLQGALEKIFAFTLLRSASEGTSLFEAAGFALLVPALLHLCVSLTPFRNLRRFAGFTYVLAPVFLWQRATPAAYPVLFGSILAFIVLLLIATIWGDSHPVRTQFRIGMAIALTLTGAGAMASAQTPYLGYAVLGALAPGVCLGYFAVRYHLFGLSINSRVVLAVLMSFLATVYLLIAKFLGEWADANSEGAMGEVVVLVLVLSIGGLLWVPVYGALNRVFSRRSEIYAEFGKRLIQDAAAILNLGDRMEFIALQVGKTFRLKRVMLATAEEQEPRVASFGFKPDETDRIAARRLGERVFGARLDAVAGPRAHRHYLHGTGFPYLFPLWYERRLVALLFVDCSPRLSLGDDEQILWGISRQISHSIESCRLFERKITLEKELARSKHLAVLGQMAATIAHEVKNPLSSIRTIGTLMQEDETLTEQSRRDLSFIVSETKRLNTCVEQLLSFARPKTEARDEVSLSALLGEIARVLSLEQADHGVHLVPNVDHQLTVRNTEPRKLREIVLNLALNAVQASEPGSQVELNAEPADGERVRIEIRDNGKGIPLELRERIFEPFFTTKQKGTGLGLAIVAQNVEQMGGELRIESPLADGRGTSVSVLLPSGVPRNEANTDLAAHPQPAG